MNIGTGTALVDGFACGPSAAVLWGIPLIERPEVVHVATPTRLHQPAPDGIQHHRIELKPWEVTTHLGVPVTTVLRTLRDLAAWTPRTSFAVASWDGALRKKLVRPHELERLARSAWGAWAGRVHRVWMLSDGRAQSVVESVARVELVLRGTLVAPQFRLRRGGHRYDLKVLDSAVLIECQSKAFHGERELAADCQWDNEAIAAKHVVAKVLYAEAIYEPDAFARRIESLKRMWPAV